MTERPPTYEYDTEAMELANKVWPLMEGHTTVSIYLFVSMILGRLCADSVDPDVDGMMKLLRKATVDYASKIRREDFH